jgi:two-component system phosphate regulon sensor histidine kinase PhoR
MRSSTLTRIVFFFTVLISLIIVIQLFWLNKLYSYEQKQFTTSVIKVARGILEDMELSTNPEVQLQKVITSPDRNSFLIQIDAIPQKDSLLHYANAEMEDFNLFTDCRLAVYDYTKSRYLYEAYVPAATSRNSLNSGEALRHYKRNYSFIHLFFPHRGEYVLHEMSLWIIASVVLLLMLIALGASVFYLYRQKFLNEIQNDFIRNITHEFQTPLTTLKLGLDMISKPGILEKPEKLAKYTSLMQSQTDYLHQHIENLVKVIKTDTTALTLQKETFNPNDLIKNAVEQMQFQIE